MGRTRSRITPSIALDFRCAYRSRGTPSLTALNLLTTVPAPFNFSAGQTKPADTSLGNRDPRHRRVGMREQPITVGLFCGAVKNQMACGLPKPQAGVRVL